MGGFIKPQYAQTNKNSHQIVNNFLGGQDIN